MLVLGRIWEAFVDAFLAKLSAISISFMTLCARQYINLTSSTRKLIFINLSLILVIVSLWKDSLLWAIIALIADWESV